MEKELVIKELDNSVLSVISNVNVDGFKKAFLVSEAISNLKELLTVDYMKPIMSLQGSKLGFKTDKDGKGGYSLEIIKQCLIDAVLIGLMPTGNLFNIIANQMYITKEGCGYLLNKTKGLSWRTINGLPHFNAEKSSCVIDVTIEWTVNDVSSTQKIPIALKVDQYTSIDALSGKATRKARHWLLTLISGIELPEGEADSKTINTSFVEVIDPDDLQILFLNKQEFLPENVKSDIERILNSKEEASYKKALNILNNAAAK
jgi:hypothetical protein